MNWRALLRLLRPHQWSKNLLCLLPLLLSGRWGEPACLSGALSAMAAFSLLASLVYIVNDLMDVRADRAHPHKRHRPLAAGLVSVPAALVVAALLGCLTVLVAFWQPEKARWWLVCYAVTALAYTWRLKTMLALDVVALASFYGLRVLYGGAAAGIPVSVWTLVFCLFLFFTLALVKRYAEVAALGDAPPSSEPSALRRPYRVQDRAVLLGLACAGANTSLLVVALYLNSPEVRAIHQHPQWLWLVLPALMYWLARILVIVHRGEMHHDPLVFALRDRASWAVLLWTVSVLVAAK
ncbi:MAG: UbiA family prenyltransferase [Prosthecobacter sp.]|nr:UbiA family prenyltransferase [Prosthecobacter sp.]